MEKSSTRRFQEELADTDPHQLMYYSANPVERWISRTRRKIILDLVYGFGEGMVLDAGCGDGFFLEMLRGDVYGVDISEKRLKRSRKKNIFCKLTLADLCYKLPFKDASFNIIILTEVIEHLKKPSMGELLRILKKGGYLIVSAPNEYLWRLGRLFTLRFPLKLSDHYHVWTPKKLNNTIQSKPMLSKYIPNLFYPLCMIHIHVYQK